MRTLSLLLLLLIISSCEKDQQHLIAKNQLGDLTQNTKISDIENLLKTDSVIIIKPRNPYGELMESSTKEVQVFDTTDTQILNIKPDTALDSISHIKNIRIFTDKYKTKNGIGLGSTFAEVKKYHDIGNIQSSPRSIVISLEDLNALISFDREVLPGDIQFDLDADIKNTMIPDDAKINRFWLIFEADKKLVDE